MMERTSAAAREIVGDAAEARSEKTARLRAMRLKQEDGGNDDDDGATQPPEDKGLD